MFQHFSLFFSPDGEVSAAGTRASLAFLQCKLKGHKLGLGIASGAAL